jgi:hypothetical protein
MMDVRELNRSDALLNSSAVCSISVSQWAKTGSSDKFAKLCERDTDFLLVKHNFGCMRLELLISFYRMSLVVSPGAISTTTLFCIAARIECHDIFLSYWALHLKLYRENAKTTLDSSRDISEMPTRKSQFLMEFTVFLDGEPYL